MLRCRFSRGYGAKRNRLQHSLIFTPFTAPNFPNGHTSAGYASLLAVLGLQVTATTRFVIDRQPVDGCSVAAGVPEVEHVQRRRRDVASGTRSGWHARGRRVEPISTIPSVVAVSQAHGFLIRGVGSNRIKHECQRQHERARNAGARLPPLTGRTAAVPCAAHCV